MPNTGTFYWNELNTLDVKRAKAFYAETMGWTYEDSSSDRSGGYWFAMHNGQPVAGILPISDPVTAGHEDVWIPYLAVDDVDERAKAALAAGATLVRDALDVPETGRRVILREPGGALVAWMSPFGG